MIRLHFKQTKENFEYDTMRVDKYIFLRYDFLSFFLASTSDLIFRLNNSLIIIEFYLSTLN